MTKYLDQVINTLSKMSNQRKKAIVYTDGACINNGCSNAKAGIGVFWGENDERNISETLPGRQTNNRAEIYAAAKAIEQAKQDNYQEIVIRTDSDFLYKSATQWMPNWQNNGWKNSNKKTVINKEDFIALNNASKGITVVYEKIPAHSGIPGNEAADRLANKAIRRCT